MWLREGFDCSELLHQSVEFNFDLRTISMECNPKTHPQMNSNMLVRRTVPIPESVFRLASPTLIPEAPGQEPPHRRALYTVVENGEERYLGSVADCSLPFLALHAAGLFERADESVAEILERFTPAALPYYKFDVNAGPVFYPVTPERAAQLLAEFGKTDETAMLVRLELNYGMARLEHNALSYPEGRPCDFSLPIDDGLCCLQQIMDSVHSFELREPSQLEALMMRKIEESLCQNEQDWITSEVGPCS